MSKQPTLTRFLTTLVFAAFALHVATVFQLMQEGARVSGTFNTVVGLAAAAAGWKVAGPRIDQRFFGSVFAVLQGMIVAVLLAASLGAASETFRLGYKTRYDDLGEAAQGFFGFITDHVQDLAVPELLTPMAIFCVGAGVVLSLVFRLLEARRIAR